MWKTKKLIGAMKQIRF